MPGPRNCCTFIREPDVFLWQVQGPFALEGMVSVNCAAACARSQKLFRRNSLSRRFILIGIAVAAMVKITPTTLDLRFARTSGRSGIERNTSLGVADARKDEAQ
jgi:hypothetical protein